MRARMRNLGVMAHVDAGKTTCSERILFLTGQIHQIGEVHDGRAKLDHLPQEQARGITITAAAHTCEWQGHQINLIDTPGHVDFTAEVERSLRVLDGAIAVFDAVAGVEPQSETVWRQADRHRVPRLVFVNKMDREGADLNSVVSEISDRLGATPVVLQTPAYDGDDFVGVVDVLTGTFWKWHSNDPSDFTQEPASQQMKAEVDQMREEAISLLAEFDEAMFEAWSTGTVTAEGTNAALRRLTIDGTVTPVFCGSALAGIGMQPLLDATVAYLPNPDDVSEHRDPVSEPFAGLAFKVVHGQGGKLTWVRVYQGTLSKGDKLSNASTGSTVRASRIVRLKAGRTQDVDSVHAGDIAAVYGLGDTVTGHTLCEPGTDVQFESMVFPEPVMSVAIEPASSTDQEKLSVALSHMADEDPTFSVRSDTETGQTLIAGMGELHLQVILSRLKDDHRVAVISGEPNVAYRETMTNPVHGFEHKLKNQRGGAGMFAHVVIDVEPNGSTEVDDGLEFVNATTGGTVPAEYAKAVSAGMVDAMSNGPLGYPLVGIKVTLTDGSVHPKDSNDKAFQIAGSQALRRTLERAGTTLLEPIMKVTAEAPDEHFGAVISAINSRRGEVTEIGDRNGMPFCTAHVPLAEMFGFTDALRSVSQGRASASVAPLCYRPSLT